MTRYTRFILLFGILSSTGFLSVASAKPEWPDPERFENDVREFEAADKTTPPPEKAIVCVGSSSMKMWRNNIKEDLAPLTVIPRGFGGSNFNDLLYYTERLVIAYEPRAVLVYEGDNDAKIGLSTDEIMAKAKAFVEKVHQALPDCRIYFISVKPSIARWNIWPEMKDINSELEQFSKSDSRLTYIDVASPMIGETGKPKAVFKKDNLHMARDGYIIWRDAVRPVLYRGELEHE